MVHRWKTTDGETGEVPRQDKLRGQGDTTDGRAAERTVPATTTGGTGIETRRTDRAVAEQGLRGSLVWGHGRIPYRRTRPARRNDGAQRPGVPGPRSARPSPARRTRGPLLRGPPGPTTADRPAP